jgi:hypothetical protein
MRKCSRKQETNKKLKVENEKKNKTDFIKFTYLEVTSGQQPRNSETPIQNQNT